MASTKRRSPLWEPRIKILKAVFPWLIDEIKELAGLPRDCKVIDGDPADTRAYIEAHERFLWTCGDDPQVAKIHERLNAAWIDLTGLPPLGTVDHWRQAADWAGIQPADFDDYLASHGFGHIAKCITAKAMNLAAEQKRQSGDKTDTKTDTAEKIRSFPNSPQLQQFISKLKSGMKQKGTKQIDVAREFTNHNEKRAKNLLRQARRYKQLWHPNELKRTASKSGHLADT